MSSRAPALDAAATGARLYLVSAAVMGLTLLGGAYPLLLNLYLLRLGYDTRFIGVLHSVALLGWAAACLPVAAVARRLGSRRTMIVGLALALAGHLLLPLAEGLPGSIRPAWLIGTYLFGNATVALFDVSSQPFLAEVSTGRARVRLFAVQAALWPLAAFLGSLAGGAMPGLFSRRLGVSLEDPAPYRYPLLLSAAVVALGVLALRRIPRSAAPTVAPPPVAPPADVTGDGRRPAPRFGLLVLSVALVGAVEGTVRTFFNVYLDSSLGVPTFRVGIISAVSQLLGAPAALAMPLLARRLGESNTFLLSSLAMVFAVLPLALIPGWQAAGLGTVATLALASVARPAILAHLMGTTPHARRTQVSAAYTVALGVSWSVTSLTGGLVIAASGYRTLFLGAAVVTAAGVVLYRLSPWARAVRAEAAP